MVPSWPKLSCTIQILQPILLLVFQLKLWWHIWRAEKPPSDCLVGCELANSALRNSTISRERTVDKRNAIYRTHAGANAKARVKGAVFVVITRLQLISTTYWYGHKKVVLRNTLRSDRRLKRNPGRETRALTAARQGAEEWVGGSAPANC
jgi:hypothetical protein